MFTRKFWKDAAERAAKSAGQFGAYAWGVTAFTKVGEIIPVAQATGLSMIFGAVASLLTSLASMELGDKGTASLVTDKETT